MSTLVWFRQDLRIADNPALIAAVEARAPVIPVFIHAPAEEGAWPPGGAARWWLHHSLKKLHEDLAALRIAALHPREWRLTLRAACIGAGKWRHARPLESPLRARRDSA